MRNLLCPVLVALTSACVHPIDDARWAGGAWTALASGPSRDGNQDDLWCFDAERCVAVNGGGQIWTTDDGGTTWTQTADRPGTFFRAVAFFDDRVGIAANIGPGVYPGVTDATVLYRTMDGGRTWSAVDDDAVPGVCNLHPVDPTTMWASGRVTGPSFVGRTKDAGLTWTWTDVSEHLEQVVDLEFTDANTGLVVGSHEGAGRVIRTTDSGESWRIAWDGRIEGELPWKIDFPTPEVGFIGVQNLRATGNTRVLRSDDGGVSWTAQRALDRPYRAKGIGFATERVGWLAGEAEAFVTTDGGATWRPADGLGSGVNRFRFPEDGVGYAIGTSVWKLDVRER